MKRILWALSLLGALAGGLFAVVTIPLASGAPQEAAGAAMACALAIVPYVLARSWEEVSK